MLIPFLYHQEPALSDTATAETLLLVLAGTFAMLPPQLAALAPDLRARVGGPDVASLSAWREAALTLRAELQAAAVTPEIQHGPKPE